MKLDVGCPGFFQRGRVRKKPPSGNLCKYCESVKDNYERLLYVSQKEDVSKA